MIPEPRPITALEEPGLDSDADTRANVSLLIETLGQTDRRLEELTAGEVDSVMDADGRSYLLRRSQDGWRQSGSDKEAAILDSLPAQIVLLDAEGVIVAVNDSWRRFADANGLAAPNYGVGSNYLAICHASVNAGEMQASLAGEGIRSVLSGKSASYSLEYACETPSQVLWFLLTVTPLGNERPRGAVVMHLDITSRKCGEEQLRLLAAAMDTTSDAIFLIERADLRVIYANEAGYRMYGFDREKPIEITPWEILRITRDELENKYDALIVGGGFADPQEQLLNREGSVPTWIEVRRHARKIAGRWIIVVLVRDVTARKQAELRIAYLNRVHAVLSGINALIVRVRDRNELYREACRIAVDQGALAMTWIGMVDDSRKQIVPVASAGMEQDFFAAITHRLESNTVDSPGDSLPTRVVSDKRAYVSNDSQNDANINFGEMHVKYGIQSIALIPLMFDEEAVGILVLYAHERDFFHDEQLKLLTELAGDVSFAAAQIEKQERLDYLTNHDVLTGLANRKLFIERVSQSLRRAEATPSRLAVCLIDLERFKNLNDSLGRSAGDALLRQVADWLRVEADNSSIARIDSDRFALLVSLMDGEQEIAPRLEAILKAFMNHPFTLNDSEYRIAAKVGVALFPDDGSDADTLFKHAELALKKSKIGGDRYLFYAAKMTEAVAGSLNLENRLRQALELNQFVLHYQPKFHVTSGRLVGAEALIRWNDPVNGLVPPARFIPILEETGLIHEVGRFALNRSLEDYLRWQRAGLPVVRLAVNISAMQLRHRDFVLEIQQIVNANVNVAQGLELELTESLIMEDVKVSTSKLQAIRSLGVRIAIDDFGTGFSSLNYLSKLPIDTVKIDRSFVAEMATGPEGLSLVSIIINLAHSLKLKVVAEGVETEEQSRLLRLLNCDEAQGFLMSKPLPAEVFEQRYLISHNAAGMCKD